MIHTHSLRFSVLLCVLFASLAGWPGQAVAQEPAPDVVESLETAGADLAAKGEYPAAEGLFRRALAIMEESRGATDTSTVPVLHNLAELLQVQGKEAEAESMLRRALAIREQALSPSHPDVGRSLSALGGLLRGLGQFEEAETLFSRATNVFEVAVEQGAAPGVQIALLTELGDMHYSLQRYGESERDAARGLAVLEEWKAAAALSDPDEATVVHNLAALFFALDDLENAELLHRRALEAREATLEPLDKDVLQSVHNLAVVLESQGKHEAADSLFHVARVGLEESVGPEHPNWAIVSENHDRNFDQIDWGRGGFELNGHVGILDDRPEFKPEGIGDQIRRDAIFGVRFGYNSPFNVFVQAEAANSLMRILIGRAPAIPGVTPGPEAQKNINVWVARGTIGYNLQPRRDLQLFVAAGPAVARFDTEDLEPETHFLVHYGVGARYFLTPKNAMRLDVRLHSVFDALPKTRTTTTVPVPRPADLTLAEVSIGVLHFFGGFGDSDRDGVEDDHDACPETLRGIRVGGYGCALDTDLDEVVDYQDMCRATPLGAPVNHVGCPDDTDRDGVLDGVDECPDTAPGELVNRKGCPIDDKNGNGPDDGKCICEPADSIPLPPFHIDSVPDAAEIIPEIIRAIDEGRDLIAGVNFDFNRSAIREDSESVLRTLGEALVLLPELRMEIQGHTDSTGSEVYNQGLSERRAQAVLDYLLETFPELQVDQFVAVGLGELVPLRDNGTEEGRAANRRVQLAELEPVD